MADEKIVLRDGAPEDVGLVLAFIRELADYERLLHEVTITEADLLRDLFGPSPRVFCTIAETDSGEPAGFALWFYTYSTFVGRHGIYLEDLFVRPAHRGRGAGKALILSLAARCLAEGLGRLEWSVLNWNAPSIAFYRALGAIGLEEWTRMRVSGPALAALGAEGGHGGGR